MNASKVDGKWCQAWMNSNSILLLLRVVWLEVNFLRLPGRLFDIHLVQIVFLFICAWAESAPRLFSTSAAFVWKRSWSSCKRGRSSDTSEATLCQKRGEGPNRQMHSVTRLISKTPHGSNILWHLPKKVDTCCTEDRGLGSEWSWGSRTFNF